MSLEEYKKTGNTKTFETGEHLMFELVPIVAMGATDYFGNKNGYRFNFISAIIPEEYEIVDIKCFTDENVGTYMEVISRNIVPVEAEEYKIADTDIIGYFYYGKKIQLEQDKIKTLKQPKTKFQGLGNYQVR